ncbi:PA26 p53-induced protein-domain-containing protein [Sporodiniella umbellata]|nr:PA26 p53-induced protein-domain-containing protein [Sporodiniella umbellata]
MNQHYEILESIRDSRANKLQACRQRIALFKGLQVESFEERALALEKIIQVVKSFIRSSSHSPVSSSNAASPIAVTVSGLEETELEVEVGEEDSSEFLSYYLLTILRLSYTCPYADVRQTFQELLSILKETTSLPIPQNRFNSPSHFISLYDVFSLESSSSSTQFVCYPRSSNISFSPWSSVSQTNEESDPSMPDTTHTHDAHQDTHTALPDAQFSDFTGGRPSDEYVRQMMIKTFTEEGRLLNLQRILSFFPSFFEIHHLAFTKMTKAPLGPLHRTWKTYLALMVAASQRCQYLVSVFQSEFLLVGGDPDWLRGIDYVPVKLKSLSGLVLKLARQPWRLSPDDVTHLLTGDLGDAWSRGELVQAVLLIGTFLGLSSFILGCAITPEIDMTGGFDPLSHGIENELNQAIDWHPVAESFSHEPGIGLGLSIDIEETTKDLISKLKSKKHSLLKEQLIQTLEPQQPKPVKTQTPPDLPTLDPLAINAVHEDLDRFLDPLLLQSIGHETFDPQQHQEFMLGEYCWEDHGCDLANYYLPGLGDDLVAEFTEAISITDWSIFHPIAEEVVDTSPLRYAIWYHTQKIMGVSKEDYTYTDIPIFLNERTMQYLHDLCMSPHKIKKTDWCNIGISLRSEEKCHVNLLIASARKQAVLCYGLYLISEV